MDERNGWHEHKLLVLQSLERLTAAQEKLYDAVNELRTQQSILATKLTVIAAVGSIVAGTAASLLIRWLG